MFPRLRRVDDPNVAVLFSRLEPLEEDHRQVAPLHARVETLGQRWLTMGSLTFSEAEEFRTLVAELAATYGEHIHIEDSVVFPIATKLLSPEQKAAIGRELASRGNVSSSVRE